MAQVLTDPRTRRTPLYRIVLRPDVRVHLPDSVLSPWAWGPLLRILREPLYPYDTLAAATCRVERVR